jgi:hypothetical protein
MLGGGVLCYNVSRWCIRQDTGLPPMLCFQADGDSQFPVSSTLDFSVCQGAGFPCNIVLFIDLAWDGLPAFSISLI